MKIAKSSVVVVVVRSIRAGRHCMKKDDSTRLLLEKK